MQMEPNNKVNIFIKDLENKINLDEKKLDDMNKKRQNILSLIDYIKNLQTLLTNDTGSVIRCELGDGIYINGKINANNKTILINIGSDVYVDLTFPEAIDNLLNQQNILDKRIEIIKNELIKNKAYIKLTKGINETLVKHQLLEGNLIKTENNKDSDNFMI